MTTLTLAFQDEIESMVSTALSGVIQIGLDDNVPKNGFTGAGYAEILVEWGGTLPKIGRWHKCFGQVRVVVRVPKNEGKTLITSVANALDGLRYANGSAADVRFEVGHPIPQVQNDETYYLWAYRIPWYGFSYKA